VIMGIEILVVAPTFAFFVPGAYIGLYTTTMSILMFGDDTSFDWTLQLGLLALSTGAALGLIGLALAIPLSSAFLGERPWFRRLVMFGLGAGLLSAGTGLFFVLRGVGNLEGTTLLLWLGVLGMPMVVGGRHMVRLAGLRSAPRAEPGRPPDGGET